MTPTFLKNFIGFAIMLFLKGPLALAGTWMVTHAGVTPEDWAFFASGVPIILLTLAWSWIENSALVRRLTGTVTTEDARRISEISLRLPSSADPNQALAILAAEKKRNKKESQDEQETTGPTN